MANFSLQLNHKMPFSQTIIILGYFKDGETKLTEVKSLDKGHIAKARIQSRDFGLQSPCSLHYATLKPIAKQEQTLK